MLCGYIYIYRTSLEASSRFGLSNHSYNFHWVESSGAMKDKDTENGVDLMVSYKRAISEGFLVGANLYFHARFYDYLDEETYKEKEMGFSLGPAIEYHPFGTQILRNLFVEGSLVFSRLIVKLNPEPVIY